MKGVLRLAGKELFELLQSVRGILLVVVLPSLLLVLVGEIHARSLPFRVLVAGEPQRNEAEFDRFVSLLGEVSIVEMTARGEPEIDPLVALNAGDFDLLVNLERQS